MASKEAGKTAIRATLDHLKQFLSDPKPPRLSESDTKANFIEKYIEALGYRGLTDITREYYVKNSQEFIDYMLRSGDRLLLAVEAKALQHDLTDKAAAQLVQYCAVEGIEWCVLTNGRELRLYNQYLKGALDAKLIFKLDLVAYNSDQEFDALFEQLWLISKESMSTPSGIKTWMEHQQLDKTLRALLLDATSAPVKSLRRTLADQGINVSPEAVTQWFRMQLASPVTPLLPQQIEVKAASTTIVPSASVPSATRTYWVIPAGNRPDKSSESILRAWLRHNMWGMHKSTAGRTHLKPGDHVCFYAAKVGVVVIAEVAGTVDRALQVAELPEDDRNHTELFYEVPLTKIRWLPEPIPLDESLRNQLDAFRGRSPSAPWGWFVQSASRVSERDFRLLTSTAMQATG